MTLDQLTNAPHEIIIDGQTYLVSALTLAEWGRLQAWIKDRVRDPVAVALDQLNRARASGVAITAEDQRALLHQARLDARTWPPRVGSHAWFDIIEEAPDGGPWFVWTVLRKHQPQLTLEQARAIEAAADGPQSSLLIYRALGIDPPTPDPKATSPGPGESTETGADPTTLTTPSPTASSTNGDRSLTP